MTSVIKYFITLQKKVSLKRITHLTYFIKKNNTQKYTNTKLKKKKRNISLYFFLKKRFQKTH